MALHVILLVLPVKVAVRAALLLALTLTVLQPLVFPGKSLVAKSLVAEKLYEFPSAVLRLSPSSF